MNTPSISDTHLVQQSLRNLPWLAIYLALISIGLLFLTEAESSQAVFALELTGADLKIQLAFDTTNPLKGFGAPLFTSFFLHDSPQHLFANLPWLMLAGAALQKQISSRNMILILALGHLTALLGAMAARHFASAPPLALGMSGGVFALLFAWIFYRFKFWSWVALLAVIAILLATHLSLFLSHAPALITGWLCSRFVFKKKING